MPYLTLGGSDPARDLPRREDADAPHPLAPTAETDSEYLWSAWEYDSLKWARNPRTGQLDHTYAYRPAVIR